MTQPAVTFQVRQLEESFKTRLFDRTHNRISLTEAGRRVYKSADRIFELYAEMEDAVRSLTGEVSGVLTLGASTTIAEYMLPALLGDFKAKYADLSIHVKVANTEGIVSMVENNTIDVGVVEAPVTNKNLAVEVCRRDRLAVIVSPNHPLAQQKAVKVADLLPWPFIYREEGSGTREVIEEYMAEHSPPGVELHIAMEFGSPEAVKGAVEAGMGISIISRATLQKELRLGTLAVLDLDPPLERPFSFVHQRQKFRLRVTEDLLEFIRAWCRQQT